MICFTDLISWKYFFVSWNLKFSQNTFFCTSREYVKLCKNFHYEIFTLSLMIKLEIKLTIRIVLHMTHMQCTYIYIYICIISKNDENERKKCYLLANYRPVILHYVFPNFRSCQLQEDIGMSMQRHFKYNLFVSLVIVGLAKIRIVECTKRMYACNRFADANVRVSDVKQRKTGNNSNKNR